MQYHVVRRLARGATSVVDLAIDSEGRELAVKRVAVFGSGQELAEARHRIMREAEALSSLHHPGIVSLLAVEDESDEILLVMPFLSGGTLASLVAARGALPPDQVALLAEQLLSALAAAHRLGIVHRDIKPENVLFDAQGQPVLADFGMARYGEATVGLTGAGRVVGTPSFMAPEQARGLPASAASDVFSLGATLVFALTGRGPWGMANPQLAMWRAAHGRVRLPHGLPCDLRRLLSAMLARNPARRPSATAALASARAAQVARGTTSQAPAGMGWATLVGPRATRGRPVLAFAAVGAALLVLGALLGATMARSSGRRQEAAVDSAGPCTPLPYQPCGRPPAPFTDGVHCVRGHDDYDGNTANGCEAAPDTIAGAVLAGQLRANIVPADEVDEYLLPIEDRFQLMCNGKVEVRLTSPPGVAQRVEVLAARDRRVLAQAVSGDGVPATAVVHDPSCLRDDAQVLRVRVRSVSGRSAQSYTLESFGSF